LVFVFSNFVGLQLVEVVHDCLADSGSLGEGCSFGKTLLVLPTSFFFSVLLFLFVWPIMMPFAILFAVIVSLLDRRFGNGEKAIIQYSLGGMIGLVAGLLFQIEVESLLAVLTSLLTAISGVWVFRHAGYRQELPLWPNLEKTTE
jgi:hypothetical protein